MAVKGKMVGIHMQKFNHCDTYKYYENLTIWVKQLRIGNTGKQ
jgi:hypothetical protein